MPISRADLCHKITMDYFDNGVDKNGNELPGYAGIQDRERIIDSLADAGDAIEEYLKRLYADYDLQKMTKVAFGGYGDEHFPEMLALIDKKIELLRRSYSPELAEKGERLLERAAV